MSITAQTAWAAARALAIAGIVLSASAPLSRWLAAQRGRARTMAWALVLAPFFTPPLLISYAYSTPVLVLVARPFAQELFYAGVLALKWLPVAVVVRVLIPPAMSAEARHIYRRAVAASWWQRARFRSHGAGAGPWMMGALVFLLAFADFELASLWSVKTWTVSIFDAQTGGMALGETLRLAAAPFAVQAAVLVLGSIVGRAAIRSLAEISADRGRRRANRLCGPFAVCAALVGCIVPLAIVAWQAFAGIATVVENFVLTREVGASVLFALGAAALASACAPRTPRVCAMPGLLGALVIALLVLALFQLPILRAVYDTPLPLLIALCIVLFPVAAIMEAIARMGRMSPMRHIAGQFPSPRLNWELRLRPLFAAFALLFWCAYFDFTASSILAPLDMTPVFVRLHNLAHYRQTAVLSAMMLAAFAAPGALLLLTLGAGEIYARRNGR